MMDGLPAGPMPFGPFDGTAMMCDSFVSSLRLSPCLQVVSFASHARCMFGGLCLFAFDGPTHFVALRGVVRTWVQRFLSRFA